MSYLSTGPIENNLVSGERPTQLVTIKLVNQSDVTVSLIQVEGYYMNGTRTLYISELYTVGPNEVLTKDYYANFDSFEFVFTTPIVLDDPIQVSVWGKSSTGQLVTAHRLVYSELYGENIGYSGATGATGATGSAGVTGATGPAGSGAIIPYASGLPVAMTTVLGGLLNTSSIIGFGSSATNISVTGGTIDLTGAAGTLLNFAFSVPRTGTITSLAAYFSTTTALSLLGSTLSITASLFSSSTPNNIFTAVPGAVVTLSPSLQGILALGTISSGTTTGLSIPVTLGERLLLVFSASVIDGVDVATTIAGYGSAGVTIV
ncbi:exosporium glycoprotein BclB-related protein [Paenibacillus pseudetheri]|uniref:Spore surface glycoprotein BclB n=1 Tax=Paenibacillus pseudetheri TaxID=2897682 RepID=A0ABM9BFV1_9BACL|nr:exosporium glycoprotein BclB-related protein [Paenibacillus pseudetheri]CAH1057700.1 hypothetical protein PAECIP111894_03872 [Paenibacillus pseudetheri]